MTDGEINRAVAESVSASFECSVVIVKDYCNSYDAIMPLVKALKKGREYRFAEKLLETTNLGWQSRNGYAHIGDCYSAITATPRQLCEAYLAVGGVYYE
jgi:hypothetical protein